MYLTGNDKPDFRTICNFKKTVAIAKSLGIANLGHISTDGTKMKANASNGYTLSKEKIKEIEEDSGKKLKNAAKKIIEQHALGDENLGGLPEETKASMDNGYYGGPNLRYLEEKGLDGYIPDSKQAQKMKGKKVKDGTYSKDKFEYDEEKYQFICPITFICAL